MGRPSLKDRAKIPVQHRALIRLSLRFDKRAESDVELLNYLRDPETRAHRTALLLKMGYDTLLQSRAINQSFR